MPRCYSPMVVADKNTGRKFVVPCGHCYACLKNRAMDWSNRLQSEAVFWPLTAFLTLTYDDAHLSAPFLIYEDVQLFLKRLRKKLEPQKIRFYCVGEYGLDRYTTRPHWHLIVFGLDQFTDPKELQEIWGNGFVYVDPCNQASIRYVCGYMLKSFDLVRPKWERPVMRCSKGLGQRYCDSNLQKLVGRGEMMGNRHVHMPRYYLKRIQALLGEDVANQVRLKLLSHIPGFTGDWRRDIMDEQEQVVLEHYHDAEQVQRIQKGELNG